MPLAIEFGILIFKLFSKTDLSMMPDVFGLKIVMIYNIIDIWKMT